MRRRITAATLLLAGFAVVAPHAVAGASGPVASGPGDSGPGVPSPDAPALASAVQPRFTQSWTRQISPGQAVSTSSPVLVDNGGDPFVVAAEVTGRLRAFDLDTGAPRSGWSSATTGFDTTRAPLSSDGTNVYVPVAQDGHTRYPRYLRYDADGRRVWDSNPTTNLQGAGFMLSGMSLARVGGQWQAFAGSSSMQVHSVNPANGAQNWAFFNADSTMATPAVADLYGIGTPQVVFSSDTTASGVPGDRNGGILRILTADGKQVCSAAQFANGDTYRASGYNNSTPAIAQVDGRPVIAFGSTGPVQFGAGANQVLGHDAACRPLWASPALAGRVDTAVSFADLTGAGRPSVLVVVGVADGGTTYPRVYALDPATGAIQRDSGASLRSFGALIAYTTGSSITTADIDGDGGQDLFVPARQGDLVVLDGSTFDVITTIPTNVVLQNTPIVTSTPAGVRVTVAGYNGLGSQVSSYVSNTGSLGERGWHHFGSNPQLTGVLGEVSGPQRDLLEGQTLASGRSLTDLGATLAMQSDGNLVAYAPGGTPRWSSGTFVPGSRTVLGVDGNLEVWSPGNVRLWQSGVGLGGVERLVLDADGSFRIVSGYWGPGRQLSQYTTIWVSNGTRPRVDGLWFGQVLPAGRALFSADRSHELLMQTDGNLVLYRRRDSRVVWTSGTSHSSGRAELVMGQFGELAVRVPGGPVLRDFGTGFKGADRFTVRNDGNLTVTAPTGATLWQARVVK